MLYPFHWIEQKSCTQFIGQNTLKAIYHEPLDVETWEWVRIEAGCWGYLPWRKGEGSGRQAGLNQHIQQPFRPSCHARLQGIILIGLPNGLGLHWSPISKSVQKLKSRAFLFRGKVKHVNPHPAQNTKSAASSGSVNDSNVEIRAMAYPHTPTTPFCPFESSLEYLSKYVDHKGPGGISF